MGETSGARAPARARQTYAAVAAAIGWFGLAAQLYLMFRRAPGTAGGFAGAVFAYLSFFTIHMNLLLAIALTAAARETDERRPGFFSRPRVASALATYATLGGLIYSLLLRHIWAPTGLQRVADIVLHDVMPIAYVLYWLVFVPKGQLRWRDVWPWLLYPLGYSVYAGVRGAIVGIYPYHFLDVGKLGAAVALRNLALMMLLFIAIGLIVVAVDRAVARRAAARAAG